MDNKIIAKSLLIWFSITPLAMINGAFREYILSPRLGIFAQPVSGLLLAICIFTVSYLFIPRLGLANKQTYIRMGIVWVFATIIFETLLGAAMGLPFSKILMSYNILTGNLWLLIVIFMGFVPYLAVKLKKRTLNNA
jgi:hypothetical protein